jgi:hypothetical protein
MEDANAHELKRQRDALAEVCRRAPCVCVTRCVVEALLYRVAGAAAAAAAAAAG